VDLPGIESISVDDLRSHIEYLASDRLQGRAAGTKGNDAAAIYISKQFKSYGLDRLAANGRNWFQDFEAESNRYKTVPTRNVLGIVRGTDETLADECVIVGAHFDHVGLGDFGSRERQRSGLEDRIHNGADDNASGSAAMLELAQAFGEHPARRSIVFIAFSAEELGLLGSYHYCKEPQVPLEATVAMFNIDMIGRSVDDYLFVGGVETSPAWGRLLEEHVVGAGLDLERGAGGRAPSDNTPFFEKGIPVLFFHTNVHVDYHRVSDHAEFINFGATETIARAVYGMVRATADADERPEFVNAGTNAMPASSDAMMRLPSRARDLAGMARARAAHAVDKKGCGRMGFAPGGSLEGDLVISELLSQGPAAAAGLEVGDVILSVGGQRVRVSSDVASALKGVKAGEEIAVGIRRKGAESEVAITVGK